MTPELADPTISIVAIALVFWATLVLLFCYGLYMLIRAMRK